MTWIYKHWMQKNYTETVGEFALTKFRRMWINNLRLIVGNMIIIYTIMIYLISIDFSVYLLKCITSLITWYFFALDNICRNYISVFCSVLLSKVFIS